MASSTTNQVLVISNVNSAYNLLTSANIPNIILNNSVKVQYTNIFATEPATHANAAIWLKDYTSSNGGIFYELAVGTYDETTNLEFNGNTVLDTGNLIQEIENIFIDTPLDLSSIVITGNIANDLGYVNFISGNLSFPTGSDGVGIRYNYSNSNLEFASSPGDWVSLTNILNFEYFRNLLDVHISDVTNNQYITYNASTSKYINSNLAIINDHNPTLGANLVINPGIMFTNNSGGAILDVFDINNTNTSNFITIQNSNADIDIPDPIITVANSADVNVGLILQSKGSGDITLSANSGNVYINSTNIDIYGYTIISTYYTSNDNTFTPENNNWHLPLSSDTVIFDFNSNSEVGSYNVIVDLTGTNGQLLNLIFYSNRTENDITVTLNFGSNGLGTGGGFCSTMIFNNPGQSASLIFLNGGILNNSIWQLRNSGAFVE